METRSKLSVCVSVKCLCMRGALERLAVTEGRIHTTTKAESINQTAQ